MKRNTLLIFSIAALALSACGDDDGRNNNTTDGGDSGSDGSINTPDGSVPDATSTPDGSVVDNTMRECGAKPSSLAGFATEPMCAAKTYTCLEACANTLVACLEDAENMAEQNACVTAAGTCETTCNEEDGVETVIMTQGGPQTFSCSDCQFYELFGCIYDNGCDTAIANVNCCGEDKCAGVADQQACLNSMCAAEGQALQICLQQNGQACGASGNICYPEGTVPEMGDAGVDAGADAGT